MPRGLIKGTHAWSTVAARQDWAYIRERWPDLAAKYEPPARAGHRVIDRSIGKVKAEAEANDWWIPSMGTWRPRS